ncbi:hypothetical protein [Serratia marcescens]|uniref:Uncharacterized protein n=1 Tax=Serratia marcescens TaxID=615 RepID=A0A9X8VL40_SERMA|nr:hypothetical protein [Serratia marcescens]MBS3893072.1 hypothetical protein [Serratia marcescens]
MNLIEILRQVKPGDKILRRGKDWIRSIEYRDDISMLSWLVECSQPDDLQADSWLIESHSSTNALGPAAVVGAEPLRLEATAIANLLRQDFDTKRPDEVVRELWLVMQLLATPERCADFLRRVVIISG